MQTMHTRSRNAPRRTYGPMLVITTQPRPPTLTSGESDSASRIPDQREETRVDMSWNLENFLVQLLNSTSVSLN